MIYISLLRERISEKPQRYLMRIALIYLIHYFLVSTKLLESSKVLTREITHLQSEQNYHVFFIRENLFQKMYAFFFCMKFTPSSYRYYKISALSFIIFLLFFRCHFLAHSYNSALLNKINI